MQSASLRLILFCLYLPPRLIPLFHIIKLAFSQVIGQRAYLHALYTALP